MYASIAKINMQDKYNKIKNELNMLWLTKNISTYQNKRHKQIMIIFVDFRENIEIKTKL